MIKLFIFQAEANLGCAVTYTLFEFAKENADDLLKDQPEVIRQVKCHVDMYSFVFCNM